MPFDQPVGEYRIRIGIFATGWNSVVHWNDSAGSITVLAATDRADVEGASDAGRDRDGHRAVVAVDRRPRPHRVDRPRWLRENGLHVGRVQPRNDPIPRTWSWSTYDARVAAIHAAGLRGPAMLGYTRRGRTVAPPTTSARRHRVHWPGSVLQQFAKRYIPAGVTVFEVWNEPNLTRFWTTGPNVTATYGACSTVRDRSSQGCRDAGTSITIITGGTAPATNGTNIDPRTWVTGLYSNGAQPYFDAIGHHPYTWPYPPYQNAAMAPGSFVPNQWNSMIQTLDMRATMLRHGDVDKQIWATEVVIALAGCWSDVPDPGHQNFVSNDLMATRSTRSSPHGSGWRQLPTRVGSVR